MTNLVLTAAMRKPFVLLDRPQPSVLLGRPQYTPILVLDTTSPVNVTMLVDAPFPLLEDAERYGVAVWEALAGNGLHDFRVEIYEHRRGQHHTAGVRVSKIAGGAIVREER